MAWMPLKEYTKLYAWPKLRTLQWIIWKTENTIQKEAPYIKRWGKRVMIDGDLFQAWVASEEGNNTRMVWVNADREKRRLKHEHRRVIEERGKNDLMLSGEAHSIGSSAIGSDEITRGTERATS